MTSNLRFRLSIIHFSTVSHQLLQKCCNILEQGHSSKPQSTSKGTWCRFLPTCSPKTCAWDGAETRKDLEGTMARLPLTLECIEQGCSLAQDSDTIQNFVFGLVGALRPLRMNEIVKGPEAGSTPKFRG